MEKLTEIIEIILVTSGVIIILLMSFFLITGAFKESIEKESTYENCCGGIICTDTYYSFEDNTCHLVLCEQLYSYDEYLLKTRCQYKGKNISINTT